MTKLYKHLIQTNLFNLNQKRERKDDNKHSRSQNNVHKKKRS